jgi:hypothetical protein
MEDQNLQYRDGNVIVRLSLKPGGICLLHRDVLAERSAYFRTVLCDTWSQPKYVGDGEDKRSVWTLDLVVDQKEDTCFLMAEVCHSDPSECVSSANSG